MDFTLLLTVPRWAGGNTELLSNSNVAKTVRVNIVSIEYFKEYKLSNGIQVDRLCIGGSEVIDF